MEVLAVLFISLKASSGKLGDGIAREAGNDMWPVTLEGGVASSPAGHSKPEAEEAFGDSISSKVTTYVTHASVISEHSGRYK